MTAATADASATQQQAKQFGEEIMARALGTLQLDDESLGRLTDNGDEFLNDIVASALRLSTTNQYADEETESDYGYLSGYRQPRPIGEQVDILAKIFSLSVGGTAEFIEKVVPTMVIPHGAEGLIAVPKFDRLGATYSEALLRVIAAVKTARDGKFYNYREGELGDEYVRLIARTEKMMAQLAEQQPGDFIIVPAQLGMLHRGKSVRRAREVMRRDEFGLDAIAFFSALLTHPNRLQHYDDLWVDLPGNEYAPDADGDFSESLFAYFSVGRVEFGYRFLDDAIGSFGSASGFLPQLQS